MNALHRDIKTGEIVVLKKSAMAEAYQTRKWRLFKADGGFGLCHSTVGRRVYGEYVEDGEANSLDGWDIDLDATTEYQADPEKWLAGTDKEDPK